MTADGERPRFTLLLAALFFETNDDFASLRTHPEWTSLLARASAARAKAGASGQPAWDEGRGAS